MESTPESQQPSAPLRQRPTEYNGIRVEEVDRQCHELRMLLNATFVALLLLSVSLNLFLGKQMRLIRAKVSETRPVIQRMQAEFQKKEPNMRNFVNALQSFGAVHQDFLPILNRYRQVVPQYFTSPVAVSTAPQGSPVPVNPAIGQAPPSATRPPAR